MIIEETIHIKAPLDRVWQIVTDLGCWKDWNTVLRDVTAGGEEHIAEGGSFRCSIRPYRIPLFFQPVITEVIANERIVWTSRKYGIHGRHEFLFHKKNGLIEVTSRETFTGLPTILGGLFLPRQRIRKLTVSMLKDLKQAAES